MASESFIHTLLLFVGIFLKISRWVPLMSLLSRTHSDTALFPRISRELQTTRCFVNIKHCIERIKQYKIDDIIVSKALACVCLLFFSPQTGLLSQSYRHQDEGRGEGFPNKVFAELLSLKDQVLYTLLTSIPFLAKRITGHIDKWHRIY